MRSSVHDGTDIVQNFLYGIHCMNTTIDRILPTMMSKEIRRVFQQVHDDTSWCVCCFMVKSIFPMGHANLSRGWLGGRALSFS